MILGFRAQLWELKTDRAVLAQLVGQQEQAGNTHFLGLIQALLYPGHEALPMVGVYQRAAQVGLERGDTKASLGDRSLDRR